MLNFLLIIVVLPFAAVIGLLLLLFAAKTITSKYTWAILALPTILIGVFLQASSSSALAVIFLLAGIIMVYPFAHSD